MRHDINLNATFRRLRELPPEVPFEQVAGWVRQTPVTGRVRWLSVWLSRVWRF